MTQEHGPVDILPLERRFWRRMIVVGTIEMLVAMSMPIVLILGLEPTSLQALGWFLLTVLLLIPTAISVRLWQMMWAERKRRSEATS